MAAWKTSCLSPVFRPRFSYFFLQDTNYNVVALYKRSSGSIVERYWYEPYGKVTFADGDGGRQADPTNKVLLFQGQRRDPETELCYFKNRYYSPVLGRFLQRDPRSSPDRVQLYEFAGSCPLGNTDPMGEIITDPRRLLAASPANVRTAQLLLAAPAARKLLAAPKARRLLAAPTALKLLAQPKILTASKLDPNEARRLRKAIEVIAREAAEARGTYDRTAAIVEAVGDYQTALGVLQQAAEIAAEQDNDSRNVLNMIVALAQIGEAAAPMSYGLGELTEAVAEAGQKVFGERDACLQCRIADIHQYKPEMQKETSRGECVELLFLPNGTVCKQQGQGAYAMPANETTFTRCY